MVQSLCVDGFVMCKLTLLTYLLTYSSFRTVSETVVRALCPLSSQCLVLLCCLTARFICRLCLNDDDDDDDDDVTRCNASVGSNEFIIYKKQVCMH